MLGQQPRYRRHAALIIIATLLLIGGFSAAFNKGFFITLDHFIYDLRMSARGPIGPSGKVVLALMDDRSAIELQKKAGVWSRSHLTQAIANLCRAGAEIIGLDLILATPGGEAEVDQRLAQTIYDCNNVVLARVLSARGVEDIQPYAPFQNAMIGDGYIDLNADKDEVIRRLRYLSAKPLDHGGVELIPAFALEVVRSYLNIEFGFDFEREDGLYMGGADRGLLLPYPELLINYAGLAEDFPRLSFVDAVRNQIPANLVDGRIVLMGSSLLVQKDFFISPLSRFRTAEESFVEKFGAVVDKVVSHRDAGIAIHGNAAETLLAGNSIREPAHGWVYLGVAVSSILGLLFYVPAVGLSYGTGLLAVLLTGTALGSYVLFTEARISLDISPLLSVLAVQFVAGISYQRRLAKQRAAQIHDLFGRYVSPAVANELVAAESEVAVTGQRRELTILFSDLRGFTSISERMAPEVTVTLLNQYFNRMIPAVFAHRGTIDKLMGDAIMAFFGAPQQFEDHPQQAAEAALQMLELLIDFRRSGIEGAEHVFAGIGLNTAEVTLGNLGSDSFMDYTVIGDGVNLAARLEGLNKTYGTSILMSGMTAERLDQSLLMRELDRVQVKGKNEAVPICELIGYRDRWGTPWLEACSAFADALQHYRGQRWDAAEQALREVLARVPEDGPARLYLDRIARFRQDPPPPDWDGVTVFDHK